MISYCLGTRKEFTPIPSMNFPDGTFKIDIPDCTNNRGVPVYANILWKYENDAELAQLIYVTRQLQDNDYEYISLYLPYIPNARMDRIHSAREVFTLKYFCEIINSLNFFHVYVLDPHSNVSAALLNKVVTLNVSSFIEKAIESINSKDILLYFPDEGAMKRYSSMFPAEARFIYGEKKRDWETGKILGLEIQNPYNIDIKGKTILMIDDIISYGGSLYYSALKLSEYSPKEIYAYASHTENSVLDREKGTLIKALEDGTVKKIFTTDSLYTGEHKNIEVFKIFE